MLIRVVRGRGIEQSGGAGMRRHTTAAWPNTKGSWEASHQEPFARGSLPDGPYEFAS
jgi:hypothetical protein